MIIRDANPWGIAEASISRKTRENDDSLAFLIQIYDPFQVDDDNILAFITIYRVNQKQNF